MSHDQEFFRQLKVVEQLLGDGYHKERLIALFFVKAPFVDYKGVMERAIVELNEPRWGIVQLFCLQLGPRGCMTEVATKRKNLHRARANSVQASFRKYCVVHVSARIIA